MKKYFFLFIILFVSISFGLSAQETNISVSPKLKSGKSKDYFKDRPLPGKNTNGQRAIPVSEFAQEQNYSKEIQLKQEKKIRELLSELESPYNDKRTITNFKARAYEPDSLALVALYDSTNGDKWSNNRHWLKGNLNTWYGISVNDSGYVTIIDLHKNKLTGAIPTGICSLSNLQVLNLGNNQLTGIIPAEIGNLSNLEYLGLNYNQLTGTIPGEIGKLSRLKILALYSNKLSGTIPAEIGGLKSLQILGLSFNHLSGTIPPEIGNLSNLQRLFAEDNELAGTIPAEIGNLSNLHDMALQYNQLTGKIPAEIGNLKNLQDLLLYNNHLSGAIPAEIGNLKSLQILEVSFNHLNGTIPSEIGNLSKLQQLFAEDNELTGTIPVEMGNLSNLKILYLYYNQLTGPIPAEIGNLKNLIVLDVSSNQLTGAIPAEIGNLNRLVTMWLSDNQFTKIPTEINNIDSLGNLSLNNNRFVALPAFYFVNNRVRLYIENNFLTFEDIEPIIADTLHVTLYTYSPQAKVGKKGLLFLSPGDKGTVSVSVGGRHNTYQWYKNNIPIPRATGTAYSIINFVIAKDTGFYYCEIKNTVATELTLTSEPVHVSQKTYHILTFYVSDGTNAIEEATVSLTGYGKQTTSTNGITMFSNVASENNIVYTVTDTGYYSLTDSITVADSDVKVNITLSVAPAKKPTDHVKIYPNPSNGLIKIESNFALNGKLEILNIAGQIVYSVKIKSEKKTINLKGLPKGAYFIKINSGNYSKTEKLIIN